MANSALIRAKPTNSHDNNMASIFRDAANDMEEFEILSKSSTTCDQRFRVPISQARTTPFGIKNPRYNGDFDAEGSPGIEFNPKSSNETIISPGASYKAGLSRTHAIRNKTIKAGWRSHEVKYPTNKRQLSPPTVSDLDLSPSKIQYPTIVKPIPQVARSSSSSSSVASDCHSSHGVPLVIPLPDKSEEKMNSIDSWLTEVRSRLSSNLTIDDSPRRSFIFKNKERTNVYPTLPLQSPSVHPTKVPDYISNTIIPIEPLAELSDNKENAPPKGSPVRASPLYSSALMRSPSSVKLSPTRLYSALSPSPHSPLRYPPRRIPKALAFSDNAASEIPCPPSTPFTIHEDDWGADISPLSPNVEVYRKRRSPRSKRDQLAIDLDRLLKKLDWEKKSGAWEVNACDDTDEVDGVTREEVIDNDCGGDEKDDGFWTREDKDIDMRKGRKKSLGVGERSEDWAREKLIVEKADEGAQFGLRARVESNVGGKDGKIDVDRKMNRYGGRASGKRGYFEGRVYENIDG